MQIDVENRLDTMTTVHWHGLLVPGQFDRGPHEPIEPGHTWRPVLKIDLPLPPGTILALITIPVGRFTRG